MVQATPETEWVGERLQNFVWLLFLQKHSLSELLRLVSLVFHYSLTGVHVSDERLKKKQTYSFLYIYIHMYACICIYVHIFKLHIRELILSQNHRITWIGRDLEDHLGSIPLLWTGLPTILDCPETHQVWP